MFWKNQTNTIGNPKDVFMETVKEPPKSITKQLQEFQRKTIQDRQIAQNKKEYNERRFTETIKPMLDELVNFDNRFVYWFTDRGVTVSYKPINRDWAIDLSFYADQFNIINASSRDWLITYSPPSTASESDRFVFYIKAFFGHYLV